MKAKLLKKVRRRFRLIENCVGETKPQWKSWIGIWEDLSPFEACTIYMDVNLDSLTHNEEILLVLRYYYGKYRRKTKIRKQKENTCNKIWYNK